MSVEQVKEWYVEFDFSAEDMERVQEFLSSNKDLYPLGADIEFSEDSLTVYGFESEYDAEKLYDSLSQEL